MNQAKCVACGGDCHEGFLPERSGMGFSVTGWVEGHPTQTFFGSAKTEGLKRYPIQAYRCGKCGRLEFYANPSTADVL